MYVECLFALFLLPVGAFGFKMAAERRESKNTFASDMKKDQIGFKIVRLFPFEKIDKSL